MKCPSSTLGRFFAIPTLAGSTLALASTLLLVPMAMANPLPSSQLTVSQSPEESEPSPETALKENSQPQTLKVGTKEILPFVSLGDPDQTALEVANPPNSTSKTSTSTDPYGYSIEFWNEVSQGLDVKTEWVSYGSVSELLDGLKSGEVDAAIAGISITSDRESDGLDFSFSYYRSGLQLMVRSPEATPIRTFARGLFNWTIWRPLLMVVATSAGIGALIWRFEHKHNDSFSNNPVEGVGQGLWFSLVTLGTFGYGDVTPTKLPGRIIACIWMGASFFIVADFIASLTVDQLTQNTITFEDLRGESVGVIAGTTGDDYVRSQPVKLTRFETFEAMITALEADQVQAVVHDYPTLKYISNNNPDEFELTGDRLTQENYGVAFRENDETVEIINQEILSLQETGYLRLLTEKWFGKPEESP